MGDRGSEITSEMADRNWEIGDRTSGMGEVG